MYTPFLVDTSLTEYVAIVSQWRNHMGNHEQIKLLEETHVPEDEVSLLFHSQLIGQMKHQYSPRETYFKCLGGD